MEKHNMALASLSSNEITQEELEARYLSLLKRTLWTAFDFHDIHQVQSFARRRQVEIICRTPNECDSDLHF